MTEVMDQSNAIVETVINSQVPQNAGKLLSCNTTGDYSSSALPHMLD
jgi:hypothetical protein